MKQGKSLRKGVITSNHKEYEFLQVTSYIRNNSCKCPFEVDTYLKIETIKETSMTSGTYIKCI
jgi:hypothetical protein